MVLEFKKESLLISPKMIRASSSELEVLGTFNPAAMRLPNGNVVLYVRVLEKLKNVSDDKYFYAPRMVGKNEFKLKIDRFRKGIVDGHSELDFSFKDGTKRLTFISHFRRVWLDKSGLRVIRIERKPSFFGLKDDGELGVEDPRLTKIGNLYVLTYVTLSRGENVSTSYAVSNDCINWERRGIMFREQNKDVVLFPEIINMRYVALDRPEGSFQFTLPHIWISYSQNLDDWGNPKSLFLSGPGNWDSGRIGAGPPPVKTKEGWLLIYHGVLDIKSNCLDGLNEVDTKKFLEEVAPGFEFKEFDTIYCAGAALFDLNNPEKLLKKSTSPIIFPHQDYEIGTFEDKKVVFPTGLLFSLDKKSFLLYSGAGDSCTSVRKVSIRSLLDRLKKV